MLRQRDLKYNPLYEDVRLGRGGIAGGKFTLGEDSTAPTIVVTTGTAQSATSTTLTLAAAASATDDAYNGYHLRITGGTGSGQDHQLVSDYNGTTKVASLYSTWTTTPDSTSIYEIINRDY